ncbi:hypothetical protein GOODEAATRI_033597 [Goodea atripinnis]|uniref:Secreted protein n=1 Tax=Goodea atripinnis TaxID=208336 RepID=A0ABV0P9U0_9TELE
MLSFALLQMMSLIEQLAKRMMIPLVLLSFQADELRQFLQLLLVLDQVQFGPDDRNLHTVVGTISVCNALHLQHVPVVLLSAPPTFQFCSSAYSSPFLSL